MNVNLFISTFRHGEEDAREELDETLRDFGDPHPECVLSKISGYCFWISTVIDPFEVIIRFRQVVKNEPWKRTLHSEGFAYRNCFAYQY